MASDHAPAPPRSARYGRTALVMLLTWVLLAVFFSTDYRPGPRKSPMRDLVQVQLRAPGGQALEWGFSARNRARPDRLPPLMSYETPHRQQAFAAEFVHPDLGFLIPHVEDIRLTAYARQGADHETSQARITLSSSLTSFRFLTHEHARREVQALIDGIRQAGWQRDTQADGAGATGRASILDEHGRIDPQAGWDIDPDYRLTRQEWEALPSKAWQWLSDDIGMRLYVSSRTPGAAIYPPYQITLELEDVRHKAGGTAGQAAEQASAQDDGNAAPAAAVGRLAQAKWYTPLWDTWDWTMAGLGKLRGVLLHVIVMSGGLLTTAVLVIWLPLLALSRNARDRLARRPYSMGIILAVLVFASVVHWLIWLSLITASDRSRAGMRPELDNPANVMGLKIPAGSRLALRQRDQLDSFFDAEFSQPVRLQDMEISRLRRDVERTEDGRYAPLRLYANHGGPIAIEGWHCVGPVPPGINANFPSRPNAYTVALTPGVEPGAWRLAQCLLDRDTEIAGATLSKGVMIQAWPSPLEPSPSENTMPDARWRAVISPDYDWVYVTPPRPKPYIGIGEQIYGHGFVYLDAGLNVIATQGLQTTSQTHAQAPQAVKSRHERSP